MINFSIDLMFLQKVDGQLEVAETITLGFLNNYSKSQIFSLLESFNSNENVNLAELTCSVTTFPQGHSLQLMESNKEDEWVTLGRFQKVTNNNKTFWVVV